MEHAPGPSSPTRSWIDWIPLGAAATMVVVDAIALVVVARQPVYLLFLLPFTAMVLAALPPRRRADARPAEGGADG